MKRSSGKMAAGSMTEFGEGARERVYMQVQDVKDALGQ